MKQAVQVRDRFHVHAEVIAPRIDVVLEAGFRVADHQMGVKGRTVAQSGAEAPNDGRAKGQVRHEVAVHDVQVEPLEASVHRFSARIGQVGQICGEHRGRDDHVRHASTGRPTHMSVRS